jgi:hypothetical protein
VVGLLLYRAADPPPGSPAYSDLSASEEQLARTFATIGGLLGMALTVGLWLWMAWVNGKGRPWGRVVATILAALSALSFVISLLVLMSGSAPANGAEDASVISFILSIVLQLVGLMALWQLYRPESTHYFAASRQLRQWQTQPYGYPAPYGHGYQTPYGYQAGTPAAPRPPHDGAG